MVLTLALVPVLVLVIYYILGFLIDGWHKSEILCEGVGSIARSMFPVNRELEELRVHLLNNLF